MASVLKVNTLTGVTTAGSIAVTGEGNSTTTSLQQGLVKTWMQFNGTSTASLADSLNVGGLTDNGTGNYTPSFTNNMGNSNYSATVNAKLHSLGSDEYRQTTVDTFATSSIKVQSLEPFLGGGSADLRQVDADINCVQITGDLA